MVQTANSVHQTLLSAIYKCYFPHICVMLKKMFLIKEKISIQFKPSVTVKPSEVKLDLYGAGSEIVWRHVAWNGIFSIFTLVFGRDEVNSFCNFGRGRIST